MRPGRQATGLLTADEVAEMFCVSHHTVTGWAREGKLTGFKTLGTRVSHWRFRLEDVQALLDSSRKPAAADPAEVIRQAGQTIRMVREAAARHHRCQRCGYAAPEGNDLCGPCEEAEGAAALAVLRKLASR